MSRPTAQGEDTLQAQEMVENLHTDVVEPTLYGQ